MNKSLLFLFIAIANSYSVLNAQNAPAPIKLVQFVLTPNHSDWNYKLNEEAVISVMVNKYSVPIKNIEIAYEFGPELMEAEKKGNLILKNGVGEINIGSMKIPGFRQLIVKTTIEGHTYQDQVNLGFNPYDIEPTVKLPNDFDSFWQKALQDNSKIPMEPFVTYKPEFSTANVDVFLVRLQNYKKYKHIYGYLCKPKDDKKHPVLFAPPGAGVNKINPLVSYAEQGFISFNIEIHGLSPEISNEAFRDIRSAFSDYATIKDDKDDYYYKGVYVGCVRAIDFLTSLPEFDGQNVAVTGGSQGGGLSMVTAGLDKRVTCVVAFYPALCDHTGYLHGRAGGWPHYFREGPENINAKPDKINTAAYYDVVNFAKQISIPGFYSTGYNDDTCPPTSTFSAFNSVKAPKEIIITPISGHWRFEETNEKSIKWMQQQCGIQ